MIVKIRGGYFSVYTTQLRARESASVLLQTLVPTILENAIIHQQTKRTTQIHQEMLRHHYL